MAGSPPSRQTSPPDPSLYDSWREYALALQSFYDSRSQVAQAVQPQAVQLVHMDTSDPRMSAGRGGLLVFDPAFDRVMLSTSTGWVPLAPETP